MPGSRLLEILCLLALLGCISAFRKISFGGNDKVSRCVPQGETCVEDGQCCAGGFCLKTQNSLAGSCSSRSDQSFAGMLDQLCTDDSDCPNIPDVCCKQVSRYRGGAERRCRRVRDPVRECLARYA